MTVMNGIDRLTAGALGNWAGKTFWEKHVALFFSLFSG